ncbi:MAG: hypothetical protein AAF968_06435 [Pseudomonadota bacterium]
MTDEPTIADLCKGISATKQPKGRQWEDPNQVEQRTDGAASSAKNGSTRGLTLRLNSIARRKRKERPANGR